jgi:serine/threonine-protein kinase
MTYSLRTALIGIGSLLGSIACSGAPQLDGWTDGAPAASDAVPSGGSAASGGTSGAPSSGSGTGPSTGQTTPPSTGPTDPGTGTGTPDTTPPGAPSGACGSGGGGPNGGPSDLFPCDSPWYKDVRNAAVAADSSAITSAIGAWGTGKFMIDFSFILQHANASTPRHAFTVEYADESDSAPVPVPPGGSLEGESGYTCTTGGDCHLIVVDDSTHKLFELWSVQNAAGPYQASQLSVWDLTKHYGPEGRGLGCTSADAAGLAIMPGLIGVREAKAGAINHALRFILPNNKIRKGPSFVAPATHGTSSTTSAGGPAYGMRLRLKPSFDESKITSIGGKALVRALKTYGMLLADGGQYALTAEDDKLPSRQDPSLTWNGVLAAGDVKDITPADFEVLEHGAIQTSKDCTLLP